MLKYIVTGNTIKATIQALNALTQSLYHWLWENHRDILPLIMFGHMELLTQEMYEEYLEWCGTDEGRKYLKGGECYDEKWGAETERLMAEAESDEQEET